MAPSDLFSSTSLKLNAVLHIASQPVCNQQDKLQQQSHGQHLSGLIHCCLMLVCSLLCYWAAAGTSLACTGTLCRLAPHCC
jgi:hypothetical protein